MWSDASGKSRNIILWAILFLAFALRAAYLIQLSGTPYGEMLMVDAEVYHLKAMRILEHGWIWRGASYQAPLYPYLLAAVYSLIAPSPEYVLWIQVAASVATVWLIYLIARRIFSERVALASGLIAALCGPMVFYSALLLKPTFAMLSMFLALYLIVRYCTGGSVWLCAAAGFSLGAASTLRENLLLMAPAFALWALAAVRPLRRTAGFLAVLALGVALALSPFVVRNYLVEGELLLTSYQAGPNFYIGNSPESKGFYTRFDFARPNPEFEEADFRAEAERAMGRRLRPSEVSRYWFERAFEGFAEDPWLLPSLLATKLALYLNDHEIHDNYNFYFMRSLAPVLWAAFVPFGAILVLALLGIYCSLSRRPEFTLLYVYIAVFSISVVAFYVNSRYRLAVVPALIPFAAYFVVQGWRSFIKWGWAKRFVVAVSAIAFGALVFMPYSDRGIHVSEFKLGVAYQRRGELDAAAARFERSMAIVPDYAPAYNHIGEIMDLRGDRPGAMRMYERALELSPDYAAARLNFESIRSELGKVPETSD